MISAELGKLTATSQQLQEHNARMIMQERSSVWVWHGVLAMVLFLAGGLCGIVLEKRQTTDVLSNFNAQLERIQTQSAPMALKVHPRKAASQ